MHSKTTPFDATITLLPNLTLAALQNTSSLVDRLPPEILSHIFLLFKGSLMDNTAEARGLLSVIIFSRIGHPAVPYITPSQVSCRWRHIALNTQSFWATLLLNDVNWGQELIRRSGRVPLHVYRNRPVLGGPHSTTFIKCLSQALTQSHRIEVIDFDGAFSSSGISWKSLPLYFTETLQGVKLSNVRMITVSEIPQDGEWIKALLNLSITQSWNTIRELDITRSPVIRLPKSSNGHLVRLRLTLIPPSDIIALMETLMYLHNLEMLTLSSERGALEPPPHPGLVLKLPHLRELDLELLSSTCNKLTSRIVEHQLRTLRIRTVGSLHRWSTERDALLQLCSSITNLIAFNTFSYPCVDLGIGAQNTMLSFISAEAFTWSCQKDAIAYAPRSEVVSYDYSTKDVEHISDSSRGSIPQNADLDICFLTEALLPGSFNQCLQTLCPTFNQTRLFSLRMATHFQSPGEYERNAHDRLDGVFKMLSQLPNLEVLHIASLITTQKILLDSFEKVALDSHEHRSFFSRLRTLRLQDVAFSPEPPRKTPPRWSLSSYGHSGRNIDPPTFTSLYSHGSDISMEGAPYDSFVALICLVKAAGASNLLRISFKSCFQVRDEFVTTLTQMGLNVERDRLSLREIPQSHTELVG